MRDHRDARYWVRAVGQGKVVVIAGPTASGKSQAALAVAAALPATIVNADAIQVYRDLRILSARPDDAALAAAPHRLYGVLDGDDPCNAARWRALALAEIAAAHAAGRLPLLVGGTGLYLKALIEGIAAMPPVPQAVRARARARLEAIGREALHAELVRRDPASARLAPADAQRVLRAWEVLEATGRPLASFPAAPPAAFDVLTLAFVPPADAAAQAIARRCRAMLDAGALAEVAALLRRGLAPDRPVMKAVGVRELGAAVRGETGRDAALEAFTTATRQYAKRQRTWLRTQMRPVHVWSAQFSESLDAELCSIIRDWR